MIYIRPSIFDEDEDIPYNCDIYRSVLHDMGYQYGTPVTVAYFLERANGFSVKRINGCYYLLFHNEKDELAFNLKFNRE